MQGMHHCGLRLLLKLMHASMLLSQIYNIRLPGSHSFARAARAWTLRIAQKQAGRTGMQGACLAAAVEDAVWRKLKARCSA